MADDDAFDGLKPSDVLNSVFRDHPWVEMVCKTCGQKVPTDETDLIAHLWTHEQEKRDPSCANCDHLKSEHTRGDLQGFWTYCQHGRALVGVHGCSGFRAKED